jgi:hypothetical protein
MVESLSKFRETLNRYGVAKPNQFQVYIDFKRLGENIQLPQTVTNKNVLDTFRDMHSYYVESTYMPSHNITTSTNILDYAHFEMPYGVAFEPVQMNFYLDESYILRDFFYAWSDLIFKKDGSKGVSFYEDYVVDIYIKSLNRNNDYIYSEHENAFYLTKLTNAYPKSIGQLQYSQSSRDEVMILPVTFVYENKIEKR